MSKQGLSVAVLAALLMCAPLAFAQDADGEQRAQALVSTLQFEQGKVGIDKADAHLQLGPQFRFLAPAEARKVLEQLWGNPPDDSVLGLIVPTATALTDEHSWAVVVSYSDDGYVSDEDAAKIDYAKMLADMQAGSKDENEQRKKAGFEAVQLVGWAVPPRYDGTSKKLYWAKELDFEGNAQHTLNYDIRVLGRRGYLSLNAVAGMPDLAMVQGGMQTLLPMVDFDAGARYADHNPKTDKIAAYGLGALVAGGLAAKAGLFAKLGVLLLAGKKLLVFAAIAAAGLFKKLFGKKSGVVQ